MALNDYDWRPITFQGVTFPTTLMAISVLEPILIIIDEELADWLWRLPICCGSKKSAPAERCARCAKKAVNLMLEQRQCILDGIRAAFHLMVLTLMPRFLIGSCRFNKLRI
jgi:hypothetical protein